MNRIDSIFSLLLLVACTSAAVAPPPSNDPVTLRINLFRGSSNIPI